MFERGIERDGLLPHFLHHLVYMRVEFPIGVLDCGKQYIFQFIIGCFHLLTYGLYSVASCLYSRSSKLDAIMSGLDAFGGLAGSVKQQSSAVVKALSGR